MWKLVRWFDNFRKRRRFQDQYKALRLAGFSEGAATWLAGSMLGKHLTDTHPKPWGG